VIGLAPGGARNVLADDALRRWPIRRYRELVRRLRIDGHRVVIVGGSGDGWVRDEIGAVDGVVDAVGRTTLTELVGVLGACDVVVTHDSGPMHLALAAGTPLVALFGPTNPAERIPRAAEAVTVLHGGAELPCRPCYDGRTYAACDTRECLHQIEVDGVHRAVKERIIPA